MAAEKEVSFTVRIKDAGSAALKEIEKAAEKSVEKLFSFKEILGGIVAAAGAFSLGEIIKDMVDLGLASDKTFRQIAANLPTFTEGIGKLKEEIESLASVSGRAFEELEKSAAGIAKLGVGSAEELTQVLTAATTLADATGTSVDESAQLLIQMRREFHLTGDEALETAAKIASVSQGKIGITELTSAFQAATPIFLKFGIDADTGTRALGALVANGYTTSRAIRSVLGGLDAEGIKQWADQIHIAANTLQELTDRADLNRAAIGADNTRIKNEFGQTLEDIGTIIATKTKPLLEGFLNVLKEVKKEMSEKFANPLTAPLDEDPLLERAVSPEGQARADAAAAKAPHILSVAEKKAIEDAAKKIAELNAEAAKLAATTEAAAPKSEQFAEAIGKWASNAVEAGMDFATFDATLEKLQGVLAKMRGDEAVKKQADAAKEAADAWRKLDDAFSKLSGSKIAEFDQQFSDLFGSLAEGAKKMSDPDQLLAYLDAVDALKVKYGELRTKVVDADSVQKLLNEDLDGLAALKPGLDAMVKDLADEAAAQQHVRELAQAWNEVGRSVIAAAQAVGGLDSATAAALQNMVTLGDGVLKLFSGDIAGGLAESVTSLAALGKGLFGGDNAEAKAQAKVVEDNSAALRHLADTLKGINNQPASSLLPALRAVVSVTSQTSAAGAQYPFGGVGVKANTSGLTPEQWDAINAAAKEFNITLDGTEAAFVKLRDAIQIGRPQLEAQYQAEQKQLQEDLHIRLLRAQGFTTEANAEELAEQQARELQKARDDGASADTIAALQATQYAEAQKAAADIARQAAQAQEDLHVRLLRATGQSDAADSEAFREGQQREYDQAVRDGADAATLATLKQTQLAEATKFAADQAERAAQAMYQAAEASFNQADDVYGTGGADQATERAASYGFDLSSYDLKTKQGVDGAISYLQGLYASADQTTKDEIQSVIHALRSIQIAGDAGAGGASGGAGGSTSAAAVGYQSLTYQQGDRLGDLELRQVNLLTDIRDDGRARWGSGSLARPSIGSVYPGGAGIAGVAAVAGSTVINVGGIRVVTNSENAREIGTQIADAFSDEMRRINASLGRQMLVQKTYDGDISVTPR